MEELDEILLQIQTLSPAEARTALLAWKNRELRAFASRISGLDSDMDERIDAALGEAV